MYIVKTSITGIYGRSSSIYQHSFKTWEEARTHMMREKALGFTVSLIWCGGLHLAQDST